MNAEDYMRDIHQLHSKFNTHYSKYYEKAKNMWEAVRTHPVTQSTWYYTKLNANNVRSSVLISSFVNTYLQFLFILNIWHNINNYFLLFHLQAKWLMGYYTLDDGVKAAWNDFLDTGYDVLKDEIQSWLHTKNFIITGKWTTLDPHRGDFQFEITLPFMIKDLKTMPKLPNFAKNWNKLMTTATALMPQFHTKSDWCLWDTFYTYKPSSNPMDWVPPFSSMHKLHLEVFVFKYFIMKHT